MNFIARSLPPSCTSFDLIELFKPFGPVGNVRIVEDIGYISMLRNEDGMQAMNTLRNPYLKGRRVYIEVDNSQFGRKNFPENNKQPFHSWMENPREMERPIDYPGILEERPLRPEYNDSWRQCVSIPPDHNINGTRPDDFQPESYVYVDPHGYSRDPTMRPAPEYYYRIKLLDSNQKFSQ